MMAEAMQRTLSVAENIGIIGIFVDAKNQSAREYYEQFGFIKGCGAQKRNPAKRQGLRD